MENNNAYFTDCDDRNFLTSAMTGLWVLTAIPIGFLFGFFLEKADLCGSSAFSEVLLANWATTFYYHMGGEMY